MMKRKVPASNPTDVIEHLLVENVDGTFGIFAGTVVDTDRPPEPFQVMVAVPALGETYAKWARPCTAPDSRAVPARGQEVWVMFLDGNVDAPIWLGRPATDHDALDVQKSLLEGFEGKGGWEGTPVSKADDPHRWNRYIKTLASLSVLAGLLSFDEWLFSTLLGTSHVGWYLKNGALIALLTSLIATAWADVDTHVGLIASNPLVYLGANSQQAGVIFFASGSLLGSRYRGRRSWLALDKVFTYLWTAILAVGLLAWLVVVVPIQYLVILVSGAPARLTMRSRSMTVIRTNGWRLTTEIIPRTNGIPQGASEGGPFRKPVTSTNLLTAGLLLIVAAFR